MVEPYKAERYQQLGNPPGRMFWCRDCEVDHTGPGRGYSLMVEGEENLYLHDRWHEEHPEEVAAWLAQP